MVGNRTNVRKVKRDVSGITYENFDRYTKLHTILGDGDNVLYNLLIDIGNKYELNLYKLSNHKEYDYMYKGILILRYKKKLFDNAGEIYDFEVTKDFYSLIKEPCLDTKFIKSYVFDIFIYNYFDLYLKYRDK